MLIERRAFVLARIQQRIAHILDIVQHLPPALPLFIVAVDHGALAVGGHGVVVQKARRGKGVRLQRAAQLRPALREQVVVPQRGVEQIAAVLDVLYARLPEEIEQVDRVNGHVAQPAELVGVPGHLVNARAGFELLPDRVGIHVLKAVLRQHDGQDRAQRVRLAAVVRLARQHDRLGKGLHRVGVLGDNDVVQPSALRAEAAVAKRALLALLGAVAQLPPVFRRDDAPLQIGLSGLIALQDARQLLQTLPADGGQACVLVHSVPPLF